MNWKGVEQSRRDFTTVLFRSMPEVMKKTPKGFGISRLMV
jgi:hypothetical protein